MTTTLSPFAQTTQAPAPQMPLWAKQDQDQFNPEKAYANNKPLETGWVTIDQLDKGPLLVGKNTESTKPIEKTPMKSSGSMKVDSSTLNQEESNKATLKTIRANLARAVESVNPLSLLTSSFTKDTAAATKEATVDLFKQITGLGEKAKLPEKAPDQKTIQIKINEQNRTQQEADQMRLANDKMRKIQETANRLGVGGSNADILKRGGLTGGEISISLINQVAKEDEEQAKKQKKNIISQIAASLSPKKNLGVNMDQGFEGKNIAQNLHG